VNHIFPFFHVWFRQKDENGKDKPRFAQIQHTAAYKMRDLCANEVLHQVTLNTYACLGLEDADEELRRMEEAEAARREQEKLAGKAKDAQKLFKAV
jgi:hypothetical protein